MRNFLKGKIRMFNIFMLPVDAFRDIPSVLEHQVLTADASGF